MNMLRINPFRELDSFLNGYNSAISPESETASWTPRVDILENDDSYKIQAELAGIAKEDIKVEVDKNILTLSGERKVEQTDEKHHRIERFVGRFSRSFSLPETVNADGIMAEGKDGILTLTLPKQSPKETLKQIEIH